MVDLVNRFGSVVVGWLVDSIGEMYNFQSGVAGRESKEDREVANARGRR